MQTIQLWLYNTIVVYNQSCIFALQQQNNNTKIMERTQVTKEMCNNSSTITLRSYYKSLPDAIHPKMDLLNKIIVRCNVSPNTARNWVMGASRPRNPEYEKILSELTGGKYKVT